MTFSPLYTLDSWSAKCGRNQNLSEFPRGGWIDGEALVTGIRFLFADGTHVAVHRLMDI
jgi:hypothetical protein